MNHLDLILTAILLISIVILTLSFTTNIVFGTRRPIPPARWLITFAALAVLIFSIHALLVVHGYLRI